MKKQKKPSKSVVTRNAVMRYFYRNPRALEIAYNKPDELYAEETADTIIEIIEGELNNGSP